MSFIQPVDTQTHSIGSRVLRLSDRVASFAAAAWQRNFVRPPPSARRESLVILLAGVAIVLFIAAFAGLMLSEIDKSSRVANQARVEQRAKAVAYQLGTTLFMVENALDQAADEIRAHGDPQRVFKLAFPKQVAFNLLADFLFIDSRGRLVSAIANNEAPALRDLSDRAYFRVHLDGVGLESRINRPIQGRVNGSELIPVSRAVRQPNGDLIGVVVALLSVKALAPIWKDVGLRADDSIELTGGDGSVWLRWPHGPVPVEAFDGLSASRAIAGWPIAVLAKYDQATIDRQTAAGRHAVVIAATAGSAMVILFCFLLAVRAGQTARERIAGDAVRARLLAAVNAVPVEFVEYDCDRRLIMANQAARDASPWRVPGAAKGKTVDEVMASYAAHFQSADDAPAWKAWTDQVIVDFDRGGIANLCRPDGQWRRSYVSDMPGGGRVVVRVDITEAKRHEQQLAAEIERIDSIFQSNGAGIALLDRDARVLRVNQFVLDTYSKTLAEVVGRPYDELVGNSFDPVILAGWQRACGTQRLKAIEYERNPVHGDGTKHVVKVTANPVQDAEGRLRYIVVIGVDDTERRMAEVRLFDTARLAHLGEMATGMAHEVNQPLAVIRMVTESLIEELETPEAAAIPRELAALVKAKLERICAQVERAAGLVRNLRSVARKSANEMAPFDLVEAVRVGGDLLSEQLKAARIDFRLDLPEPGTKVRGEASQLQQVIINLVLNARDALLDDAGRAATGTLGHIVLRMPGAPAGGGVELVIEDDGPGIPAAVFPRLFEPFFTTKPTGKGTGLGLSISYDIIKRMGGQIAAENRPEGGARFRIAFPAT
jgi:PAS domain S-box-containing protein